MLERNISKIPFGDVPKEELRYLFYLSRKNAWVQMGYELVKFNLIVLVGTKKRQEGEITYFDRNDLTLNESQSDELKRFFARYLGYISISHIGKSDGEIEASDHPDLPNLALNYLSIDFYSMTIYKDWQDERFENFPNKLTVQAKMENYDLLFMNQFNCHSLEEQKESIKQYSVNKEAAFNEAFKNAVWLAAASGDSKQLTLLLNERPDFDLQETYQGKNIFQAMFSAEGFFRRPFLNEISDYQATVGLLLENGFDFDKPISAKDARTTTDVCIGYKKAQSSKWFFQSKNEYHLMLVDVIEKALSKKLEENCSHDFAAYLGF